MNRLVRWSDVMSSLGAGVRLDSTSLTRSPRTLPLSLRSPAVSEHGGDPVRLPERTAPSIPLSQLFVTRRSQRTFSDTSIRLAPVAAAAMAAARVDRDWYSDEVHAGLRLDFFVLADRVDMVERGVYHLDADLPCLRRTRALLPPLHELVIQLELAAAPALLIVSASLLAAETRHGVHGYRLLMARAASTLYAAWLAALGWDAGGCLFAGVLAPMRLLLCADGFNRAPLCALALGITPSANHRSEGGATYCSGHVELNRNGNIESTR